MAFSAKKKGMLLFCFQDSAVATVNLIINVK
jgi:hypothetical protein